MADARNMLQQELTRLKTRIEEKIASSGAKASGATAQSLRITVSDDEGALWGASHLRQMEKGRGPGPGPAGFYGIIEQWVRDKGINASSYAPPGRDASKMTDDQKVRSLAGAIAYTIMKQGTVMYRRGLTRDIYSEALEESLERLADNIGGLYAEEIQTINDNYRKDENDQS